ncbi:glycosyltransferase family 2 protein [Pontibacter sp. E15-1]|uniref:glycosyltransferase family 2 protein n=1 Tax=Pontibacter sp. E15-1 TaxID=2919918 RepID=UPI001F4FED3A|nr:glycosyltransferase family A protein [Pontibacter sp. E15-1]MCJ8165334.1 glycosyltransferase family 2 protein [Pontibacter sp. E15-1]
MKHPYTPLVSIVIAFLNEEKFLGEAIASVLQQRYTHWELLLVDDGSTDRSSGIARQHAAENPGKIHYLEHEGHANKGLSASRNRGIAQAGGTLVAFLDADDVWLPEKLSCQVRIFEQHPSLGMVAEASTYWYSWEDPAKKDITIAVGAPPEQVYHPSQLMGYLYPLGSGAAPCPSGLMLTKEAILQVGGFEESFTKQFQLYEDQAFLNKVYLQASTYISSASSNLYRQRAGSIVQQVHQDGQYHAVRQHFLEWFSSYLQQHQVQNSATHKLLKQALKPYHHPGLFYFTSTLPGTLKRALRKLKKKAAAYA